MTYNMRLSRTIGKAALLLAVSATFFTSGARAQQNATDRTIASIIRNETDNTPKSIYFSDAAQWTAGKEQEIFKKYLGLNGADNAMVLARTNKTKGDMVTSRFFQYFKGIKVEYGVATLTGKGTAINYMGCNCYNTDNSANPLPAIAESAALKYALGYIGAQKYAWEEVGMETRIKRRFNKDTSFYPHGELVWIEDYSNGMKSDRKLHLAYKFDVYATAPLSHSEIFIDATTGKQLFSNSLIKHVATSGNSSYSGLVPIETRFFGGTYQLQDLTRGSGVHTFDQQHTTSGAGVEITSLTNTWTGATVDSVAIDAQWGGEMVYDFWQTLGRNSWDDAYGVLEQYVHYDVNYNNAFWDGVEMVYGDGTGCAAGGFTPLTALDVTGHEIGHGVCQATAGLVYAGESGAMNEGFSDCWGASVENFADPHEVDAIAKSVWQVGEELGCGNPLRRMDFPKLKGDPDTYGGTNWVSQIACTPTSGNDQCGVHTNSGLLNKWFYLLTAGGAGTNDIGSSYVVGGIGFSKSEDILYMTELALTPTDDYAACRATSIGVTNTKYGPCSPEAIAVTNAWYAVGVGAAFTPCVPTIGFTALNMSVLENASVTACPATHTYVIGVRPNTIGPLIAGGNPTVNIVYAGGAAVAGVDYSISPSSLTFPAGSTALKTVTLTIVDNGAVNDDKDLRLALNLIPAGSNATLSGTNDTLYINIANDDQAPEHIEYHTLNQGTAVTSNLTSSFPGAFSRNHSQFLLTAAQLTAAGVKPNSPISQIAFRIVGKNTTSPFVGYTVSMANTAVSNLGAAFVSAGLVPVYNGTFNTYLGWDSLDFNLGTFTWTAGSNVVVDICYGKNATNVGNDQMEGIDNSFTACDHSGSNSGSGTGCGLAYDPAGTGTARPVMRFKQTVPPLSGIETVAGSTHTWDVLAGQEVYFFNTTNGKLMSGIKNISNNLGCVTGNVSAAGIGFTPAVFSPVNRSKKEFTITPAINGSITTYDATIYFTTAELAGATPSSLYLIKTDEPTDATINTSNTVVLTPTVLTGNGYVGFKGTFTGFSRYFLTDGPLCNTPSPSITAGGPTAFCPGDNVVLTGNSGSGFTYQWQLNGGDIFGETNSTYTATTPGNYTLKEISGACNATSAITVVSYAPPSAGTITGITGACVGSSITLSDAIAGAWSSTNTSIATIGSTSGILTGVAAGTVVISYDVNNTCGAATTTATITVNPSPAVAPVTGTMSLCAAGKTVSLTDATALGTWSSGAPATAAVSGTGVVTSGIAGVAPISYTVTNGFGCKASAIASVTVNALPSAIITAPGGTAICPGGSSVALNAPTGAGLTYQWELSGGGIVGETNASFTASATGNYDVIVTNSKGCSATSAITTITSGGVTVVPAVSINSFPGSTVCIGSSASYTPVPVNGGSAPVYQWYVNGVAAGSGASYSYTPANGDIVKCKLTSNAACAFPDTAINTVSMNVLAYQSPSVNISSDPGNPVCVGTLTTYSAVTTYAGSAPSFQWTKNSVPVATGPFYAYKPANGDVIVCKIISDYMCLITPFATSAPFVAAVNELAVNNAVIRASRTGIYAGQKDTFSVVAPPFGATFQWFIDGEAVFGATGSVFITNSLTNGQVVSCEVTIKDPCYSPVVSHSKGIKVKVSTGVKNIGTADNNFTLVPNPNNGTFTISGTLTGKVDDIVTIVVTNMIGQVVYNQSAQSRNGSINEHITLSSALANGTYLVNLTSGEGHVIFHVVLDK